MPHTANYLPTPLSLKGSLWQTAPFLHHTNTFFFNFPLSLRREATLLHPFTASSPFLSWGATQSLGDHILLWKTSPRPFVLQIDSDFVKQHCQAARASPWRRTHHTHTHTWGLGSEPTTAVSVSHPPPPSSSCIRFSRTFLRPNWTLPKAYGFNSPLAEWLF